jgi:hypothetical protein
MVTFTITSPLVDLGGYVQTESGSTSQRETVLETPDVSAGGIGFSEVQTNFNEESATVSFSNGNSTTEEESYAEGAFIEYNRYEVDGDLVIITEGGGGDEGGYSATASWNGGGGSIREGGGGGSTTTRVNAGLSTSEKQTTTNQNTDFDPPFVFLRNIIPSAIQTTTGAIINDNVTTVPTFINFSSTAFEPVETTSIWLTTVEDNFQIFQERTFLAPPEDTPTTLEPPPLPAGTYRGTYDVATVVVLEDSDCAIRGTTLATTNTYNIEEVAEIVAGQQFTVYPSAIRGTRIGDVKREGVFLDQDAGVLPYTITSTNNRDTFVTFRTNTEIPTPTTRVQTSTITTEEKELSFSDPQFTGYKTSRASILSYSENTARIGTLTWIETYPVTSTIRDTCAIAFTDSSSGELPFFDDFGQVTILVTSSSEKGIDWTEVTTGCWSIINPVAERFVGSSYYNAWSPVSALNSENNFGSFLSIQGITVSVPQNIISLASITGYVNPITSWSYVSQNLTISASGNQVGLSVTTINQTDGRPSSSAGWEFGGTPITTANPEFFHVINIGGIPAIGENLTVTRQYGNWFTYAENESGEEFYTEAATREEQNAARTAKLPKPVAFIGGLNSALTFATIRNDTNIPSESVVYSTTSFPFYIG